MSLGHLMGRQRGVVLPVGVDPSGVHGPTRWEAAGSEWRRSSRGRYVPAYVEQTPMQRVAEAGVLVPRFGAVTGWAALAWQRGWWFSGLLGDGVTFAPVPIAISRHWIRPQEGILLCEERLDPREFVVVDGLRITNSARSVCFAMRYALNLESAVIALDMAAYHDLVSVAEAAEWAYSHPSYTGIEKCRQAVALGDENAWSPAEVTMRLEWCAANRPAPLTNRPVFDLDGHHLGTPDLIDPAAGVVGEYDGALHLEGSRRHKDLRREHLFRAHGLEPVPMMSPDLRQRVGFQARLREAYARAERVPAADRRWTLELPSWWPATFTVEQRRALTERERATWLRHRSAGGASWPLPR